MDCLCRKSLLNRFLICILFDNKEILTAKEGKGGARKYHRQRLKTSKWNSKDKNTI